MEQFIKAIHLVQNGHVPCHLLDHTRGLTDLKTSPDENSTDVEDNSSDVSINDLWIGSEMGLADNDFESSSSNEGDNEAESDTSADTLVDLDPAHHFNWFVTTSVVGVGLFSEITTARMLCAPGTMVHYFVTLHEAMQHFHLALAMWNGKTV
ncbi:hypothetical protein CY34DRAFT_106715 [Suillus luteus UH-Slu-Lm8-n1]|uniref:Uncharacterized protein n=1 Tax=Suillus luteus UH-Slu-Lm8-n1 TaxID=930992 RepID=A0A0D0B8P7_9AGAM|nr:hypothetical protein CY34DRAFT_106715 [Suillus luteus UH-Slu-Lm8-n1]